MDFSRYSYLFVFIILTVFSTASASKGSIIEEDIEKCGVSYQNQSVTHITTDEVSTNKDNAGCSHWGLKRWFYGITEYFQRCFCCIQWGCMKEADKDRQYHVYYKGSENLEYSSDCFGIANSAANEPHGDLVTNYGCCHNPCTGTLCAPFMLLQHLCCLPFQLCKSNVNHERIEKRHPLLQPIHVPTQEEREKAYQAHQEWRIRELKSGDINRKLKAGWQATDH